MFQGAGFASAAIAIPVNIIGSVLVAFGAVGLVLHGVPTLPDFIESVFGRGVPAQIFQPIVGGVVVGMMAGFLTWKGRANKSHQNQAGNFMLPARISWQSHGDSTVVGFDRGQNATVNRPGSAVTANNATGQGSHSALIGDFVSAFVPRNRQPSFCHGSHFTVRTTHYEDMHTLGW